MSDPVRHMPVLQPPGQPPVVMRHAPLVCRAFHSRHPAGAKARDRLLPLVQGEALRDGPAQMGNRQAIGRIRGTAGISARNPGPDTAIKSPPAIHPAYRQFPEAAEFRRILQPQFHDNARVQLLSGRGVVRELGENYRKGFSITAVRLELRPDMPEAKIGVARDMPSGRAGWMRPGRGCSFLRAARGGVNCIP